MAGQAIRSTQESDYSTSSVLRNSLQKSCRLIAVVLLWILVSEYVSARHVSALTGFYRNGQVFLTWKNVSNLNNYYKVYRSSSPITDGSQLSTCEYLGWTNQYSARDHDMSTHYGEDRYLRIDSAGTPLLSTKGLFVATTLVSGSYYYAVTILLNGVEDKAVIAGVTALVTAVSEQVSKPQPVFQQIIMINDDSVEHWCNFISFKKTVSGSPINAAGFMTSGFLLFRNHNTGNQPLCIQMHGGSADLFDNIISVSSNEMNLNVEERFPGGGDGGYWGANSNFNIYQDLRDIPDSGMNHNFFQQVYLNTIEWAIHSLGIDSNRIYLRGTSKGACGAFAFTLTYPEKIAAVSLGVPCFNVGFHNDSAVINNMNPGGNGRTKIDELLGLVSTNLPSNTGINTFDILNGAWVVHSFAERDYPFIYAINGKNDIMVGWTEKQVYYDSVNANHTGGYYFWDNRDHGGGGGFWIGSNFELFRFRRNISYPAFANCSLNEDYGNGSSNSGDSHGSINGMLDWTDDIIDNDSLWRITFFIRDLSGKNNQIVVYPDSATTDITLRRIQQFHVPVGNTVNWQVIHKNQIVQSGSLLFNGGVITLPGIKAYKDTAQLQLTYSSPVVFYADIDQDGFGNQNISVFSHSIPEGYVGNNSDCNDSNATIHPGASDVCNGIDDNCDEQTDENGITATVTPAGYVSICSGNSVTLTANDGSGISYQWKKGNSTMAGATNPTYTTDKAGNYKVVESNSFNCNATSVTTIITLFPEPVATITPLGDPDICVTGSVSLQANSGISLIYQWKKGGSNITGATNQIFTASVTGTYKVVVTNSSSCSKTSAGVLVTKSCRESISNSDASVPALSVYPNPNDGRFVIDLTLSTDEDQAATIRIVNMMGQTVYSEKALLLDGLLRKEISIDHSVAKGMYLVKVIAIDHIFSGTISFEK